MAPTSGAHACAAELGDPYTDADIAAAPGAVAGKTELDALVAYLQGLGVAHEPTAAGAAAGRSGPK